MSRPALSRYLFAVLSVVPGFHPAYSAEPLPGTQPLTESGDLAAKMVAGIHSYLDREIIAAKEKRKAFWKPDFSSPAAYSKSVRPNRERLRKILGVVDARLAPRLEYVGGPEEPSLIAETDQFTVHAVRWAVLPGVDGEGLLLEPKTKPIANIVAISDSEQTPEQLVGLSEGVGTASQFARRLAERGCRVLVPVLIDRKDEWSGSQRLNKRTNQSHREFIHRMAYEMGRTLIGYEVQKVLAAVDWYEASKAKLPIGVMGYGEGGLVALYAAALDERVKACVASGCVGSREPMWKEPLDRNIWSLELEFGETDILALIVPRTLLIELCRGPEWAGPAVRERRTGAAPGRLASLASPSIDMLGVVADQYRVLKLLDETRLPFLIAPTPAALFGSSLVLRHFVDWLSGAEPRVVAGKLPVGFPDSATAIQPRRVIAATLRQKRQFDQLVAFTQKLWRDSEPVRKALFAKADSSSPAAWDKSVEPLREYFYSEVIGKLPEPTMPLNPRTRQVYDEPTWRGYEVMLDVFPHVFACGILLLPRDLKPGEKRPVIVCQHGLEGTPRSVIDPEPKQTVYAQFARKLVEKGYIVYAPQNPYRGRNEFRQIVRKANPLKLSLFSFIVRQHQRTLDWLETLPNVDPKRIAFYGLSYGGKTAMRVPAIEKRYCLSICSGDFNEWIGKVVSVDLDRSYMWSGEYEMYEFDLGQTFNYAEIAALIAPRPFMVERGHDDGVGTDEMVAYEFAKVRYLYESRLKLTDKAEIEFFNSVHRINGKRTFAFLDRHLNWGGK